MEDLRKCEGKTVIVTGGASGLGARFVEEFLKEGAKGVAILDISEELGRQTAERLQKEYPDKVLFLKCDMSEEQKIADAFNAVVDKFQQIDVIVNNAGLMNDSPKVWAKMCDVNWRGMVSLTTKGIQHMRKDKGGAGGTIINISSALALLKMRYLPVYAATKMAVLHYSQSLAEPPFFERTGIRILTMCFDATDTPLLHNLEQLCLDPSLGQEFKEETEQLNVVFQTVDSAVKAFMDMYKKGNNGSIWFSKDNRPVKDITADINKAYEIMFKLSVE